jgi:hypothetical protein
MIDFNEMSKDVYVTANNAAHTAIQDLYTYYGLTNFIAGCISTNLDAGPS